MSLGDIFQNLAAGFMGNMTDAGPIAAKGAKNLDDVAALAVGGGGNDPSLSTRYTKQLQVQHKWITPISEKLVPYISHANYGAIRRTAEEISMLPVTDSQKQRLLLHYAQREG